MSTCVGVSIGSVRLTLPAPTLTSIVALPTSAQKAGAVYSYQRVQGGVHLVRPCRRVECRCACSPPFQSSADFTEANLGGPDLRGASLQSAKLDGANLNRSDLREADLSEADVSRAQLGDCNLLDSALSISVE